MLGGKMVIGFKDKKRGESPRARNKTAQIKEC